MFCDKQNVNLLSALLPQAGVRDIVVCPGSRNGVLVHNFHQMASASNGAAGVAVGGTSDSVKLRLHAVTDERSAGFVALGLCLSTRKPVAVCVTSGSALLGTLPAVVEAYYRHLPLLVISADRPARWVGQQDGQTLPQNGALQPYAVTYVLPEPHDKDTSLWCRNIISEALNALRRPLTGSGRPVHINVPISEPLFTFTTPTLPVATLVGEERIVPESPLSAHLLKRIEEARLPLLVVGQLDEDVRSSCREIDSHGALLLLPELIANAGFSWRTAVIEQHPQLLDALRPDLVVHVGGNLVNKQLKLWLRRTASCPVIRIEEGEGAPDTFAHLDMLVRCKAAYALRQLAQISSPHEAVTAVHDRLEAAREPRPSASSDVLTQTLAMSSIAGYIAAHHIPLAALHLSNSTVVREATTCFAHVACPVLCNRGVNGIEGSLSTAVGYALNASGINLMLIGDLSFFYDQNALWNKKLDGRLRVVLFNNGGGSIFDKLQGLAASAARDTFIAAHHQTSARGIAESYGIDYRALSCAEELQSALVWLFDEQHERTTLLELQLM